MDWRDALGIILTVGGIGSLCYGVYAARWAVKEWEYAKSQEIREYLMDKITKDCDKMKEEHKTQCQQQAQTVAHSD